jgi:hypothetical protein
VVDDLVVVQVAERVGAGWPAVGVVDDDPVVGRPVVVGAERRVVDAGDGVTADHLPNVHGRGHGTRPLMRHADLRGQPGGSAGTATDRDRRWHSGPRSNGNDAHETAARPVPAALTRADPRWAVPSRRERLRAIVLS